MHLFLRTRLRNIVRELPRGYSNSTSRSSNNTPPVVTAPGQKRIDRILSRTPSFLHKHILALRSAPVSHVTAFLLLHELTAVIPLFGLASIFHYYNWLPPYFTEGAWVLSGVERFGRYFRRKGWISIEDENEMEREAKAGEDLRHNVTKQTEVTTTEASGSKKSESGMRWVIEFATAYAIVKALLIPRLMLSAWAAPAFARLSIIPMVNLFRRSSAMQTIRSRFVRK
jgi:hypothetical protein